MATHVVSPDAPPAQPIPRLQVPELDRCIQCGFCLQHCPTYRILAVETESPRGRIHLVEAAAQGRIPIDARFEEHMYVCLGCRACETACPSGVEFGTILEAARAEIGPSGSPLMKRLTLLALRHLMPFPGRLRLAAALLRSYQRSGLQALASALHLVPRRGPGGVSRHRSEAGQGRTAQRLRDERHVPGSQRSDDQGPPA